MLAYSFSFVVSLFSPFTDFSLLPAFPPATPPAPPAAPAAPSPSPHTHITLFTKVLTQECFFCWYQAICYLID